ncbi:PQQ-binding-like beta-propeller repeat protein [Streptomyces radicis]|uniref:Pyrrolo-quinoline quinone repeat domain-containing protein n=1 Tax=Streptomyces radicis TaxID=1750517 RepID=A0A3A9W8H0_9ACTN|nr:PQQ-binding-like beta-propeller repeat protein [Streptomyces radicis]RKN08643.1 hypothetical protein D7319_14715 [Streptomyces radicis]RKN21801.1 hypothetical protein D7318_15670 [Streptomyces radicis]
MSQPPPPNQPPGPPAGGYGPPPEPGPGSGDAPGGYGFPTPPSAPGTPPPAPGTPPSAQPVVPGGQPGQPGYGYPQQPPPHATPPAPYASPYASGEQTAGGSSFGAPTAPGPYKAPTLGYGPSGPNFPTPGAPSGSVPPSGRSGGSNRTKILIAVATVFALVLVAGGAFLVFGGDDGGGEPAAQEEPSGEPGGDGGGGGEEPGGGELPAEAISASLAWELPAYEPTSEENVVEAKGFWWLDDAFVRVMPDEIVSYDLATGAENWSLPFESADGNCLASPNVSENRVALLQGRDCEELTVVDISTGDEVLTMPLDTVQSTDFDTYPWILGDTVVMGTGTAGIGYSISEERKLWESGSADRCKETDFMVVDETIISNYLCGTFSEPQGGSIRATDETGEEQWVWEYPAAHEELIVAVDAVVSVEPLVVQVSLSEDGFSSGESQLWVIDEAHQEVQAVLDYNADHYTAPCEVTIFHNCSASAIAGGHLFLATMEPGLDGNALVAFDLATGQPAYEVQPINGGQIRPFGVQDGQVLAYQAATTELEGMVVAVDPETEEIRPIMALDRAARAQEASMGGSLFPHDQQPLWRDDTFTLVNFKFYSEALDEPRAMLVYR